MSDSGKPSAAGSLKLVQRINGGGSGLLAFPQNGLQFPDGLSFEKWSAIGKYLASTATSTMWCLGDWIIYGESSYADRYHDAVAQTSLDYQTLRNYAWVARRFSLSRRRDKLSFGHHAEVAALSDPEQNYWLRKAEEESWSRNRLRREVRESYRQRNAEVENVSKIEGRGKSAVQPVEGEKQYKEISLRISIDREKIQIYQSAADAAGMALEVWIAKVLEDAVQY